MEDFRSKSVGDGRIGFQRESYYGRENREASLSSSSSVPSTMVDGMQDLRCYSASYASSVHPTQAQAQIQAQIGNELKLKKGKSTNGFSSKTWSFNDPELQRKKRVASYKVYSVEGKVKGSLRKSFRWLKERCSRVVFGW